jgi:hypothetical protein
MTPPIPQFESGTAVYKTAEFLNQAVEYACYKMPELKPLVDNYIDMMVFGPHSLEYQATGIFLLCALATCLVFEHKNYVLEKENEMGNIDKKSEFKKHYSL